MSPQTFPQQLMTIALCALATVLTRALPFLLFPASRPAPKWVTYLGQALPAAVFGLLVVYCLRNVDVLHSPFGIPEAIAIGVTVLLHIWRRQMLLSIAGGTMVYMLLVQMM